MRHLILKSLRTSQPGGSVTSVSGLAAGNHCSRMQKVERRCGQSEFRERWDGIEYRL